MYTKNFVVASSLKKYNTQGALNMVKITALTKSSGAIEVFKAFRIIYDPTRVNTKLPKTNKTLSFNVPKRSINWANRIAHDPFGSSSCIGHY